MSDNNFTYRLPDDESILDLDNDLDHEDEYQNDNEQDEISHSKSVSSSKINANQKSPQQMRKSLIMNKLSEREFNAGQSRQQMQPNKISQSNQQIYTNRKSMISDNYSQSFDSAIEDQTQQFIESNLSSARKQLNQIESEIILNDINKQQLIDDERLVTNNEPIITQRSQINHENKIENNKNNYISQGQLNNRNGVLNTYQTIKTQSIIMMDDGINEIESTQLRQESVGNITSGASPHKHSIKIKSHKKRQRPPTANEFKRINQLQCTNDASHSDISTRMINQNDLNVSNIQSQQHLPRHSGPQLIQSTKGLGAGGQIVQNIGSLSQANIYQQNMNQLSQINQKTVLRNDQNGTSPHITSQKSQFTTANNNGQVKSRMSLQKKQNIAVAPQEDLFDKLFETIRENIQTEDRNKAVNLGSYLILVIFIIEQFLYNQEKSDHMKNMKIELEKQHQQKDKAEIEIHLLNKTQEYKLQHQGAWFIVQNWLFSTILDQEKCMRYALLKSLKQLEFVKQQKQAYQESKILKSLETLISFKNFQYLKIASSSKPKQVKSDMINYLKEKLGQQSLQIEQIAVMRAKPYLKQSNLSYKYEIHSKSQRLLSLHSLTQDLGRIIQSTEELFHINPIKIQAKLSKLDLEQIVIQDGCVQVFQDPECCSRDMRVFICCKDAVGVDNFLSEKSQTKSGVNLHHKLAHDAKPFAEFVSQQQLNEQSSQDNIYKIKTNETQIKKIKGTNQVKIQKDLNTFALLNECKIQDLLKSKVFNKVLEVKNNDKTVQQDNLISQFYIIEENSQFSIEENKPINQIVTKDRKVKQIRRLNDFEVLLLILKLVKTQTAAQNVEIKFQQDVLKKIHALKTLKQDRAKEMTTSINAFDDQTHYILINKLETQSGNLLKQHYLKVTIADLNATIMRQNSLCIGPANQANLGNLQVHQCNWSNCLQVLDPTLYPMLNDILQKQLHTIQQTPQISNQPSQNIPHQQSTRKRPQSGNKNHKEQAIIRKLTRLNIMLELEVKDSIYLRFMKKFKLNKEKSSKTLLPQATLNNNNNSTNISLQQASQNVIPSISTAFTNSIPSIVTQQEFRSYQGTQRKDLSNVLANSQLILCNYHRDLELFIANKFNVRLQPQSIICNNFTKALKNFESWKDEIKNSLSFDILVDTGKGNYLKENIHKIFNFSINQSSRSSSYPNIYSLLEILQQQPPQINIIESFYVWIDRYINSKKLFFVKNPHFQEANIHFIQQLSNLNQNLRQTFENEQYIVNEIKKWISSQDLPKSYLRDIYGQILEVIRVKDVIFKFQQFQFIIDRINSFKGQQSNQIQPQQTNASNGQILVAGVGRPSINAQFMSQFSHESQNSGVLPRINEQAPNSIIGGQVQATGLNLSNQSRIIQMSGMQPNIIRHDYKPQGTSSVVEKLTSIYGVSQGGISGLGNSVKKPTFQQNDFTQATIRQLIEQKITGTSTAEQLYLKQTNNQSIQQQQQQQQQNSFMARKYSAGNKKDFSLPPPTTHDISQFHQYSAKNEIPQLNLMTANTGEYIVNRGDGITAVNYNNSLNNSNNISKEVIGLPTGYINTNLTKNVGFNPNQSLSQTKNQGTNGKMIPQNYQSSPMSKSLYKAPFAQIAMASGNSNNIQVNHKQRASSAYKQRQEPQSLEVAQQQQNMSYQSNTVMRPNTSTSQFQVQQQQSVPISSAQYQPNPVLTGPYYNNTSNVLSSDHINAQYNIVPIMNTQHMVSNNLASQTMYAGGTNQNFLNRKAEAGITGMGGFQQPPPKFPVNNQYTLQQQQLQQIYNTKINKPQLMAGQLTQTSGFGHTITNFSQPIGQNQSHSKQRQDRQQAIVMTYSNAVPRIGSAHPNEKEKKKLSGTFYEKPQRKTKKQSSNNSDRKQIKLNNFVNLK